MSTYLVALVLGSFEYISSMVSVSGTGSASSSSSESEVEDSIRTSRDRIEIRVYTPLGKRKFGQHALEVAKKSLLFYGELFGSTYPLPKLDLVAIPDFACNAMENWGLITYR